MKKAKQNPNVLAPKPVHPTPPLTHGLLGVPFVQQHMMVDNRWTSNSLTEQFKTMADLLAKRQVFLKLDMSANRHREMKDFQTLRRQCRDGRVKLYMLLYGNNRKSIHNFLINHKDMQRLYQNLPLHMIGDNINQRTFVMRKERDRLQSRLNRLKDIYESKVLESADLENRIKYRNEFVLEEEVKSREFHRKIANSIVRLRAIKTVNSTYKKMMQVLRHDEIFYEPILRSLNRDFIDQATFIKHVLYIGMPAISRYKDLNEDYRKMEEKAHKNLQEALYLLAGYRKSNRLDGTSEVRKPSVMPTETIGQLKRYVRETESMRSLKNQLETIEDTMKEVKFATLCSQAREVHPRMKSQVDNNDKLYKMIENDKIGHQHLDIKLNKAELMEGLLINNLSAEEIKRLNTIKKLKAQIEAEDRSEANIMEHMKSRANIYVLLRCSIWNFNEILRYIDRSSRLKRLSYPNSYLKLPLLKFDMLGMHAVPPEIFQEDVEIIMHLIKRKVKLLMNAFEKNLTPDQIHRHREQYHKLFLDTQKKEEVADIEETKKTEEQEDLVESKTLQKIPDNTAIKALSRKVVEELSKKEE